MGGYQEKHSKQGWFWCRFKSFPSPLIRPPRDLSIFLFLVWRETPFQMELSLTNVNISHKMVPPTWFSEFFPCLLLENDQLKIFNMPKKHILGWQILLPYKRMCLLVKGKKQSCLFLLCHSHGCWLKDTQHKRSEFVNKKLINSWYKEENGKFYLRQPEDYNPGDKVFQKALRTPPSPSTPTPPPLR